MSQWGNEERALTLHSLPNCLIASLPHCLIASLAHCQSQRISSNIGSLRTVIALT